MSRREEGYIKIQGNNEDVLSIIDLILNIDDPEDIVIPECGFLTKGNLISYDYCDYEHGYKYLKQWLQDLTIDYAVEITFHTMVEYGSYYEEITYKNAQLIKELYVEDISEEEFDQFLDFTSQIK